MTDDKLYDRVAAAIKSGSGFTFNAAELVAWFDVLRVAHVKAETVTRMAHTIGAALASAGWQIHIDPYTNMVDGVEPATEEGPERAQETKH